MDAVPQERQTETGKNELAKALQYALNRSDALAWFTTDGRLAIDNNVAEGALRGIALICKNFLFLGSNKHGERAAVIYTALEASGWGATPTFSDIGRDIADMPHCDARSANVCATRLIEVDRSTTSISSIGNLVSRGKGAVAKSDVPGCRS